MGTLACSLRQRETYNTFVWFVDGQFSEMTVYVISRTVIKSAIKSVFCVCARE